LPTITDAVTIDGWSQGGPSFQGAPRIELNGAVANSPVGLDIQASNSIVRGLAINNFSSKLLNGAAGIKLWNGAAKNSIYGNYIGTDLTGNLDRGNAGDGILIEPSAGIENRIGTNGDGLNDVAERNVISGNRGNGIKIVGDLNAIDNKLIVAGNYIGIQADGVSPLGNLGNGVSIQNNATNNTIGGIAPGTGNAIAYNKLAGIAVNSGTGNGIFGNSIFNNNGLGIDLGNDGVTANDASDADAGANNLQNFPVLTFAHPSGNTTIIKGNLNSTADRQFRVEFFSNPSLDPTGFGEGKTFLGSTIVATDSNGNNSFTYTYGSALPIGEFITVRAIDPANHTSEFSQGFAIANQSPVANNDSTIVGKNPVNIDVLSNDIDPDGDPLTLNIVTNPVNGTVVVNQNNTPDNPKDDFITYTPNLQFNNNVGDSFSYQVSDGQGGTATANVKLTLSPLIEVESPDPKNFPIPFPGTLPILFPTPTAVIPPTPTSTAVISPTPTPTAVISPTSTSTAVIPPAINKLPITNGDSATVNAGSAIDINVLANDSEPDGEPLNLSIFRAAHNGKAAVNNNGTPDNPKDDFITYTPNPNFSGDDIFLYQIADGKGGLDVTKVEVTVKAVNKLPIAIDDSVTTHRDTAVNIKVLANDSDPDGDPLILTVLTNGAGGKAEINHNGTVDKADDFITYHPHSDFWETDSFTYQVDDSRGGTATATAILKFENKLPIAIDDSATTDQVTRVNIKVLANDSDPDGDPLIFTVLTNGVGGKAEINLNGTVDKTDDFITYQPHGDFIGPDSFTYQLDDSHGGTATATVKLTVNPVINPPIAPLLLNGTPHADTLTGAEGNDTINGDAGDDFIDGKGGNDLINGGLGNLDRIFGGAGDDSITDPDGVNGAHGGTGNDSINVTFAATWDNNTHPDAPRSDGKITGGIGNDSITVTMNNSDFFINLKGDEPVSSNSDGKDVITLLGTYANSVVDMGGGDDTFQGGLGADNVTGGDGNDTLIGGGGNDQLAGNAGNDFLTGGAGQDGFLFKSNSAFDTADFGSDRIIDFTIGTDKILLSQTAFGTITSAQIAFVDSDLAAETSNGLIVYSGATGKLFFNQNGAQAGLGTGALFATLDSTPLLTVTDFQIVI
jgi:Bacterial Ig domain/RTX calcium-binding nonapeptide repeat (4 copies)